MESNHLQVMKPKRLAVKGFTAIELLVAMTIVAVLAALAGPSMVNSIRTSKVKAMRDEMVNTLQLAKVEAQRRGVPVILTRTTGCETTLTGSTDWSCGYVMYADYNDSGSQNSSDAREATIKAVAFTKDYGVIHAGVGGASLQINLWGQANGTGHSFTITSPAGVAGPTVKICMNTGGRIRTLDGEVTCP